MEIILGTLALISLSISVIISFFCFKLVKKILYIDENIDLLHATIDGFHRHLIDFNSMVSYSNEPVVMKLLEHSKDVMNDIEDFSDQLNIKAYEENKEDTQ